LALRPNPEELPARCHRNFVEAHWQWTKAVPGSERRSLAGANAELLRSGIGAREANLLFLGPSDGPLEPVLREAVAFFGPRHAWRVVSTSPRSDELAQVAPSFRLRPAPAPPGMVLAPIPPAPPPPDGLRIDTVANVSQRDDFARVWCRAFLTPRSAFDLLLPEVPRDDPERGARTRLYVGYAGGVPVACSSLVLSEGVAGVVSVGTVPQARRRGYGAALTWAAVEGGRELGAEVAFLTATRSGYPVYERMGFRRTVDYSSWESPTGPLFALRLLLDMRRLRRAAQRARAPQESRH
jgi:GNAT superfamily N-acetyltransferase